jgi:hypothetical protein
MEPRAKRLHRIDSTFDRHFPFRMVLAICAVRPLAAILSAVALLAAIAPALRASRVESNAG